MTEAIRSDWRQCNRIIQALCNSFDRLLSSPEHMASPIEFNNIRDNFRDYLSRKNPLQFPRYGAIPAAVDLIFDHFTSPSLLSLSILYTCNNEMNCPETTILPADHNLARIFSTGQWASWSLRCGSTGTEMPSHAKLQQWIDLSLAARLTNLPSTIPCSAPCPSNKSSKIVLTKSPPILIFEAPPDTTPSVCPNPTILLPVINSEQPYYLRGIIYHGGNHFTARLVAHDKIWNYDSQLNNGVPTIDEQCRDLANPSHLRHLTMHQARIAMLFLYSLWHWNKFFIAAQSYGSKFAVFPNSMPHQVRIGIHTWPLYL